jgi:hypothetical protein
MTPATPVQSTPLREQSIDGERVLFLGPSVLIASKSCPGTWHVVESGACTCDGYRYRRTCRHLAVAELAAELDRCHSTPVELNDLSNIFDSLSDDDARELPIPTASVSEVRWSTHYNAYLVLWHGAIHGGNHHAHTDALAHAAALAAYPPEVQNDWRALHGLPPVSAASVA